MNVRKILTKHQNRSKLRVVYLVTSADVDVRYLESRRVMDEQFDLDTRGPKDLFPLLERVPCEERRRLLGVLRDALAEAREKPSNGLAMLDLALAWAETGDADTPGYDELIHCYRMAIHLYCARFIAPAQSGDPDALVYRSAELER